MVFSMHFKWIINSETSYRFWIFSLVPINIASLWDFAIYSITLSPSPTTGTTRPWVLLGHLPYPPHPSMPESHEPVTKTQSRCWKNCWLQKARWTSSQASNQDCGKSRQRPIKVPGTSLAAGGEDSKLPTYGTRVWSLIGEPRSHTLSGVAKKRKRKRTHDSPWTTDTERE